MGLSYQTKYDNNKCIYFCVLSVFVNQLEIIFFIKIVFCIIYLKLFFVRKNDLIVKLENKLPTVLTIVLDIFNYFLKKFMRSCEIE
jgi:hypothetical protein